MKQILMTVIATVTWLVVAALGLGAMGVVDLWKIQEALMASPSESFSDPVVIVPVVTTTGSEIKLWSVDTVLCSGTFNPEKQADGSFKCIASANLATECMGPDGEAYKNNDTKTFYKTAERTEENKNKKIECESIEKICVNGNFTPIGSTNDKDKPEFSHLDCKIIDRTKTDELPCKDDNGYEVPPGSKQARFLKPEVAADEDCVNIEEYCAADGTWKTNFPTHNMIKCEFKWSFTAEFIEKNPEKILNASGELTDIAKGIVAPDPSKKSCSTPWGETVKHGEKLISFKEKVVRFDKECHSRTHTCVDGKLEFVDPYPYSTCKIEGPEACFIDESKVTVFHDSDKKLYAKGKYEGGKRVCPEQTRHCFDAKLDGDTQYIYPTCGEPVKTGPASCPNPYIGESKALPHGREWIGYFKNFVGRGQSCDGEVDGKVNKIAVSCQYGTIQPIGNGVKISRECSKGIPKNCTTPWWTNVEHGKSVTAYNVAGAAFGWNCDSESRMCNDGTLEGSYQYQTCTLGQAVGCNSPCGTADHGGKITSYTQWSVARGNGETCSTSQIVSTCNNGKLSPTPADFCNCKVEQPLNCVGPNGENVSHFGYLTLYKFASVPGRPEDGIDECPREVRQCVNGVLRKSDGSPAPFSYSFKKCDVIPPDGGPAGTP